ncbi:MAG: hypothetical protein C0506_06390 [Anaerolinea sp.]|nr:hypothetical protein [Anaerolinea sp.]
MSESQQHQPSGIVTFVFSDIEGSTRLLKRLGDGYPDVLERQRALLRAAWRACGGYEVDTEGDSFFVAFPSASDAVRACAEGQRLLGAEPWPTGGVVRVRMGVHSGAATIRNGDYVALAIHQAKRVQDAAHGGQVLISEDAAAGCEAVPGLSFLPAGRFHLRDFDQPVRLLQLAGPGLETAFPAVRALPAEGHNLVRPQNPFVDRETEFATLRTAVRPGRLVTVVGPGGVGKTRLATEAGIELAGDWADGVWSVDLAKVDNANLVPDAIAAAVGAGSGEPSRWEDLLSYMASRNALLILDSVEAHVDLCAQLLPRLLQRCASVGALATSREPLHVAGEDIVAVGPLAVPSEAATPDDAQRCASVQLFVDRAAAARPGFELGPGTLEAIAGSCRRLDGLPLAIEIAAARTAVLNPSAILSGLDDMHHLLRSSDRSLPERQRTMQALLDWSYRLLTADEQAALRRLSVFGGGFSIATASAAVGDGQLPADDVPELVWSLVDHSLLVADLTANATRYRFLEPVRQYSRRLLNDAFETGAVAHRLGGWYLGHLGPWRATDRAWMGDVHLELDNLRSLIPLLAPDEAEHAQQLACLLGRYFDATNSYRAGIDELSRFAAELLAETPGRVALLTQLAQLHLRIGEVDTARTMLAEANELSVRVGRAPWDDEGLARAMGEAAMRAGDWPAAALIAEQALAAELSPRARARMWNLLGLSRAAEGDLPGALAAFEQELAGYRAAGDEVFLAGAEGNVAEAGLRLGDTGTAARHQHSCLELAIALGQTTLVAYSLIVAAQLAAARDDVETAVRLHAKATAMLDETGQRLYDVDVRAGEQLLRDCRRHLDDREFQDAVDAGIALDEPASIRLAEKVFSTAGRLPVERGAIV